MKLLSCICLFIFITGWAHAQTEVETDYGTVRGVRYEDDGKLQLNITETFREHSGSNQVPGARFLMDG